MIEILHEQEGWASILSQLIQVRNPEENQRRKQHPNEVREEENHLQVITTKKEGELLSIVWYFQYSGRISLFS